MSISSRIVELEEELLELREAERTMLARIQGIVRELRVLRSGIDAPAGSLSELDRTDAIVEVLRRERGAMSVSEVFDALCAAGRDDPRKLVSSTLSYLANQTDNARRLERGVYVAT